MRFPFRKPYFKRIIRLLVISMVLYAAACGAMMLGERHMVYVPFPGATEPAEAGLHGYARSSFTATDGAEIPYWEHTETDGPILLYFHGNGGGLHAFTGPLDWFATHSMHVVAMEYRGYPGAPGKPSEDAIVGDAIDLFDAIHKQYPTRPIVIWGYSLGTGVAVQTAAARQPEALILEAPFSATIDRAQQLFPLFPARLLMRDQFLSREYIGKVHAPLFIMHGDADVIIPIGLGEALYQRANTPKTFKRYAGADHYTLMAAGAYDDALAFISTLP